MNFIKNIALAALVCTSLTSQSKVYSLLPYDDAHNLKIEERTESTHHSSDSEHVKEITIRERILPAKEALTLGITAGSVEIVNAALAKIERGSIDLLPALKQIQKGLADEKKGNVIESLFLTGISILGTYLVYKEQTIRDRLTVGGIFGTFGCFLAWATCAHRNQMQANYAAIVAQLIKTPAGKMIDDKQAICQTLDAIKKQLNSRHHALIDQALASISTY